MATEWTDDKHKVYLNSIEASFVKQLYSSEYGSTDLARTSGTHVHTYSSGADKRKQSFSQFKVLHSGCWEKLKFERAKTQGENERESQKLSENPWIQHFRSHSTTKDYQMDENNLVGQSLHLKNLSQGREESSSKLPLPAPFCSQELQTVSIGNITEVSDQNFVDMEVDREEPSKKCCRKRARCGVSRITDQVVPFVASTLDEKTSLRAGSEEHREMTLVDNPLVMEPLSSCFKDRQPNDPTLEGG